MKKKVTKKQNEIKHFQKRCLQRLGFLVNRKELIKAIKQHKLPLLYSQSNRVNCYLYVVNECNYKIVYDKVRKTPITIIPIETESVPATQKDTCNN